MVSCLPFSSCWKDRLTYDPAHLLNLLINDLEILKTLNFVRPLLEGEGALVVLNLMMRRD